MLISIIRRLLIYLLTLSNQQKTLSGISRFLSRLVNHVNTKIRIVQAQASKLPDIQSFNKETSLEICVRRLNTPWSKVEIAECEIPGMISIEECEYYTYIGRFYTGIGEVVELGPWLGRSTNYIVKGLTENPTFTGRTLHVYDDFIWRASWMNDIVSKEEELPNHADFFDLFSKYTQPIKKMIDVQKRKITNYDGNDEVEQLEWGSEPIEIIYVDCGRTYEANEAWWKLFSPFFITNRTLIVLEDWDTHSQVPVQWYNQIMQWVDSKGSTLQLVHELEHGGIATFLFKGDNKDTTS